LGVSRSGGTIVVEEEEVVDELEVRGEEELDDEEEEEEEEEDDKEELESVVVEGLLVSALSVLARVYTHTVSSQLHSAIKFSMKRLKSTPNTNSEWWSYETT
jgi:hypothetical protein